MALWVVLPIIIDFHWRSWMLCICEGLDFVGGKSKCAICGSSF